MPATKSIEPIRVLDLFCGAGGSSCGAQQSGAQIVGGIDFWDTAISTFKLNFPLARTWCCPIQNLTGKHLSGELGSVDLILASPECTNHTFAKGNRRSGVEQEESRRTAFEIFRFAEALKPRWIVVENVISMRKWDRFEEWTRCFDHLGYHVKQLVLDSQEFGVPQSRRRLFVVADNIESPLLSLAKVSAQVPVSRILRSSTPDNKFNYDMTPVFDRRPMRAEDTLARARRAISALGTKSPFLIVYYGTDAAGGWQSIDRPLRTVTTIDRFALVRPTKNGHVMRMLQPPELSSAMGFPADYIWPDVTRRERIKLLGNAVCPPITRAIVAALTRFRA